MKKNKNKRKHNVFKTIGKIVCGVVGGILAVYVCLFATNSVFSLTLRNDNKQYEPVDYRGDQLVPYIDGTLGCYTIKSDRPVKILQLTDIHIGGGLWTPKQDRKAFYELDKILKYEKPDLVIFTGDNTFAVPGPIFNGGGTLNNLMVAQDVMDFMEKEGVYYTVTFGNHDTEFFDYFSREQIYNAYRSKENPHCIMNCVRPDKDSPMPSVSNQIIIIRNSQNKITKILTLLDSNSYVDKSISASMNWQYDTIHDEQIEWADQLINKIGRIEGRRDLKSLFFFHIPIGEFEVAYEDLVNNNFNDTEDTKYISGAWDEETYDEYNNIKVYYGGFSNIGTKPEDCDILFETLGPDGSNVLEACFVGHDHMNNGVVNYKGVLLSYNNTLDNIAYKDICKNGKQRGATSITINTDGTWTQEHRNAYLDYGCSTSKFYNIDTENYYNKDFVMPSLDKIK